eukprot:CAMPEP_0183726282 /NCGR_PEP_ID=MMETSP0737-20130205/22969_1 /TAXON_ID=385413 /ORGANISM="Thalassiosira miniscula, Strain CCMP1093" /LENGTH=297 /DNA_ID=CAMNT_0025957589 /DNA_START=191 /DNA_END=1084 /DNA_ORIENTATION=-
MSQPHHGSPDRHRFRSPIISGGLRRRKAQYGYQTFDGDDNYNGYHPRQNHQLHIESSWMDSPRCVGDTRDFSQEDFIRPPFDCEPDTSLSSPRHNYGRPVKNSASDCISVASDQAVIFASTTNEGNSNDAPSSFHSDVTMKPTRQQEEYDIEEVEEDSFDPDIMPAPPTDLLCQPHQYFHRLSRPVCLAEYELGQQGRRIHMRVEPNIQSAQLAVASLLRQFDAAFIKRSDGRFTYAILAEICRERDGEPSKLRFVVDSEGSTKNFRCHKWGDCVRLIREPIEANSPHFKSNGKERA